MQILQNDRSQQYIKDGVTCVSSVSTPTSIDSHTSAGVTDGIEIGAKSDR
jgi:hypothetical protein